MLVNVTIPVFNEEKDLPRSIAALHAFLGKRARFPAVRFKRPGQGTRLRILRKAQFAGGHR